MSALADSWRDLRGWKWSNLLLAAVLLLLAALIPPNLWDPLSANLDVAVYSLAYILFALGLNIVVGFAGLLDLGYVAFYAIGGYSIGWFASDHFSRVNGGKGIHFGSSEIVSALPGFHFNFLIILMIAMVLAAIAGTFIGLPTLRLRGDYIAIVTLAFGEIAGTIALNGEAIEPVKGYKLTLGQQAISPIDEPSLPGFGTFNSALDLTDYYYLGIIMVAIVLLISFMLRDSRIGRAWIAIREDEVAAASMGVPLVRTKLLSYAIGAAIGGAAGAFLGAYTQAINSTQYQFSFSILVLAMIILGGLGNIWGAVVGAIVLSVIDRKLIPDTFHTAPHDLFGLNFTASEISFGIFGFLLVMMMLARPEGLIPERRRKMELTEGVGVDESLYEAQA
jgi:branched-chain amino acid transport system permease protein